MLNDAIKNIITEMELCEKVSDTIRFIDPVQKKVISYKGDENISNSNENCFDYWRRNQFCDNCVSMRAYNNNKSYVKIEYHDKKVILITAIPVEFAKRRIIIEMIKDISDSLVLSTDSRSENISSEVNAILYNLNKLVLRDDLTQIYNRRFIDEKLPIDLINSVLSKKPLSLIMADIDFFKTVNDTYGHIIGDCVLRSFVETIKKCLKRESDWLARYGGEEFLVCLPGASLIKTKEIAEMMRKSVEKKIIKCGDHKIKITASFGIYSSNTQEDNYIELINQVDERLYQAKKNGRNRVEF